MKRPGRLTPGAPPKRRSWLARGSTPIARRSALPPSTRPIRPRNAKRHTKEWRRAFESEVRVLWVQSLPSVASGRTPCENVHVRTGGGARKADACWIVPLTHHEHIEELHQHGKVWFEAKYGISLDGCARATEAAWRALNPAVA